jgi:hypothetical protein
MPDFYGEARFLLGFSNGNGIAKFRVFGVRQNLKQHKLIYAPA